MLNKKLCALAAALLVMLASCGACAEVYFEQPPAEWADKEVLEWTVFDVGQGDCMLLSCGGESMMVDGGFERYHSKLSAALDARGLRHMRYILNTHFHDDHVSGLYQLFLNGFTADEYLQPHTEEEIAGEAESTAPLALKAARAAGVPMRIIGNGDTLKLGGADIEVFRCLEFDDANASSLVLRVTFAESSLLLCADITGKAQHWYVENMPPEKLDVDVIKLPHHSITPAVAEFLKGADVSAAIGTTGKNIIGGKAVRQLKGYKIPYYLSGDGTVYAATDGTDWYIYQTRYQF